MYETSVDSCSGQSRGFRCCRLPRLGPTQPQHPSVSLNSSVITEEWVISSCDFFYFTLNCFLAYIFTSIMYWWETRLRPHHRKGKPPWSTAVPEMRITGLFDFLNFRLAIVLQLYLYTVLNSSLHLSHRWPSQALSSCWGSFQTVQWPKSWVFVSFGVNYCGWTLRAVDSERGMYDSRVIREQLQMTISSL